MSSYKKDARVHLQSEGTPLELRLINHQFNTVAKGVGELNAKVAPGIYQIEARAGKNTTREFVELQPGQYFEKVNIQLDFDTTAPVPHARNSHEFHGYPTQDVTLTPNRTFGSGGRLVIVFRDSTEYGRATLDVSPYTLLDAKLQPVGNLTADVQGMDGGYSLSADVTPGGYVLRNTHEWRRGNGSTGADMPLWVEPEWTTIIFVPGSPSRPVPLLRGASIHMTRTWMGYRYDEGSEINAAVELVLGGLREGRSVIPAKALKTLLDSKYENPMLGIIGAQALLLEPKPRWTLFDTVYRNLKRLIPHHPDVIALFVMGKERRGKTSRSRVQRVTFPPMMYAGYRGLISRDAEEPGLIAGNSLADQAASRLYRQSPWSLWKPFEFAAETEIDPALLIRLSEMEEMLANPDSPAASEVARLWEDAKAEPSEVGSLNDPEVEYVAQYMQQLSEEPEDEYSRSTSRGGKSTVRVQDLSKQIGLPVSSIVRAIQTISEKGFGRQRK